MDGAHSFKAAAAAGDKFRAELLLLASGISSDAIDYITITVEAQPVSSQSAGVLLECVWIRVCGHIIKHCLLGIVSRLAA